MAKPHKHAVLIDALGGAKRLSQRLSEELDQPVSKNRVQNWKARGVSWPWRPILARIAREGGKAAAIPEGFILGTEEADHDAAA